LAQKSDGRFITHFGLSEENLGLANYYSGEALLALVLQAEHGDDVAAETCRRSFRPYRDHFRAAPTTAFIGWHAGVWSRLAIAEANEEYADFVFEQIDWLLRWQICKSKTSEWIGGFSEAARVPQSASVVYTEAILHALRLAHLTGNRERSERFAEAARRALMFCARLRLENVPTTFFPDPLRCRGGVAMGLAKKTVRSDVVQHFITMCLAAIANPVEIL